VCPTREVRMGKGVAGKLTWDAKITENDVTVCIDIFDQYRCSRIIAVLINTVHGLRLPLATALHSEAAKQKYV
jgi:hypothetical protein